MRFYFIAKLRANSKQKGKYMSICSLTDNTRIEIKEGASLDNITAIVKDFTSLGMIADALVKPKNMDSVKFESDELVTGNYSDMKLERPLFKSVDITHEHIEATFAIREKTEIEKRLDAVEAGQDLQDGALADLGDIVSTIAEGGIV